MTCFVHCRLATDQTKGFANICASEPQKCYMVPLLRGKVGLSSLTHVLRVNSLEMSACISVCVCLGLW